MEVTRKNFINTLPLVSASIEKADFLVIDTEFTGLSHGRDVTIFDTPDEYYNTTLNGCSDFLLIQFGLCAFYWDEKKNHYMNDAYNFYLFPRGQGPGQGKIFLCQSSSLDFLAAQGFDFNKLIREGISYMTEPTENKMRDNLTERQKLYSSEKDNISIPEENKQQIEDICKDVHTFLHNTKENEMEIDGCNAFVRRLLFQELGKRFKKEVYVETKVLENKNRVLKVMRLKSASDMENKDAQKKEKEWEDLEELVGFSKVARMISQSEKLVIGHNMLLDLLHTLNHFFQPLPNDYESFKEFAHCMFPRLLDTKYMSSLPPFKDKVNSSVLQHLLDTLSKAPFSLPKVESQKGRGYTRTDDKQHEAGYDAYVTGLCFLGMQAVVSKMRGDESSRINSDSPALKPFLNKLFLAKTAHQNSPYMNLSGPDPSPSRDHVFHLTFPKEWHRNDINELFSPFGSITVQFVDDTTAFVALWQRENARDVLRALAPSKLVSVVPYSRYKASQKPVKRRKLSETAISPADAKHQQVSSRSTNASPVRGRSNSLSVNSPTKSPQTTTRKRTSSGVFRCDDAEPPPKKPEVTPEADKAKKKAESKRLNPAETTKQVNGNAKKSEENDKDTKTSQKKDQAKEKAKKEKQKIIERFDAESGTKSCVSVFKESENWD